MSQSPSPPIDILSDIPDTNSAVAKSPALAYKPLSIPDEASAAAVKPLILADKPPTAPDQPPVSPDKPPAAATKPVAVPDKANAAPSKIPSTTGNQAFALDKPKPPPETPADADDTRPTWHTRRILQLVGRLLLGYGILTLLYKLLFGEKSLPPPAPPPKIIEIPQIEEITPWPCPPEQETCPERKKRFTVDGFGIFF